MADNEIQGLLAQIEKTMHDFMEELGLGGIDSAPDMADNF